jgi:aconitate hydratase
VSIYEASRRWQERGVPTVVLAGNDYGMGSSRDWAAKGTYLLGVRAVLAESYERIHRSNLVGHGRLPLQYLPGQTAATLGLDGTETFDVVIDDAVAPKQTLTIVVARKPDGSATCVSRRSPASTRPVEIDYYRNGGILHTVLRALHATTVAG